MGEQQLYTDTVYHKKILNVIVAIVVTIWLLNVFGLYMNLSTIRLEK